MSAVQRAKRKTAARINFDEEESGFPAKKKSKIEAEPAQFNGNTNGVSTRKSKTVYEEEVDGFTFSRSTRGRKAQPKSTASTDTVSVSESAPLKETRTTKAGPPSARDEVEPKRRRSARLSGDKEPAAPSEVVSRRPKKSKRDEQPVARSGAREGSPHTETEDLAVHKKRDATRIALPFADTPIIKRNKEMRAAQNKRTSSSRRSSAGIRGRRASSLIESGLSNGRDNISLHSPSHSAFAAQLSTPVANTGKCIVPRGSVQKSYGSARSNVNSASAAYALFSNILSEEEPKANTSQIPAIPHADVEILDFYKLIENELPEQRRMRQLLTWCATRALLEKPRPTDDMNTMETIAIESARQIQEELLKDFASNDEYSNWFNMSDDSTSALPKKPNPRNVRNQEKLSELEEEIKRIEAEEKAWKSLLSTSTVSPRPTTEPIKESLLSESQRALLPIINSTQPTSSSATNDTSLESLRSRLSTIISSLEPTIDSLRDGVHRLAEYSAAASDVADRVTSVWARRLESRDKKARKEGGNSETGARDVLRALAGKLVEGSE